MHNLATGPEYAGKPLDGNPRLVANEQIQILAHGSE
jgi:hypothetical protein